MLCLCSDLVPVNPPTLHDEHYLHTVFIEPIRVCFCVSRCVYECVMFGHDCRVNAIRPCHIEPGGLVAQFEDKKDPCFPP